MLSLLNPCIAALSLVVCLITSVPAEAGLLPERVEEAAQARVAAAINQTLVFGVVDGDKNDFVAFGKLDNGKTPDGDTVYEIESITKTFTATLLAFGISISFTRDSKGVVNGLELHQNGDHPAPKLTSPGISPEP